MLDLEMQLHREYFLANTPGQRLFVALHLQPQEAARRVRPPLAVAFVVDTSGSMRSRVTRPTGFRDLLFGQGVNKLQLVTEALQGIVESDFLQGDDRMALIQFDDSAQVLLPFTPIGNREAHHAAAERLKDFNGGTEMGEGMRAARQLLEREKGNRRMVVLTDGRTDDELSVRQEAGKLAELQVPATTVGVGSDVNTELLTAIADQTQGKPMDVVPDAEDPQPPAVRASELPAALLGDLKTAANEVLTGVTLTIRTIKDVTVERVTRVQPTQSEVALGKMPLLLGNLDAQAGSTFIIEFSLPARTATRVRLGQLMVSYQVPATEATGELEPADIVVEFTADEASAARLNADVMRWVQQRNVEGLILQATREMAKNPGQAQQSLQLARQMTERLGNVTMTRVIDQAMGELKSGKTMTLTTAKTLQIGAKTQTLRVQDSALPNEEEIRRITGA